jgi:hypothetical protein
MQKHFAIILCALFALPAVAEQDAVSAAAPGRITFTSDKDKPAMTAKVKAVGQTIVSTPALANPKGMAIDWSVRITAQQDGMPNTDPFPARGLVLIRKIDLKRNGRPDAEGRFGGEGEGPSIKFTVNDPFGFYWGEINAMKPATATFNLPLTSQWEGGTMTVKINGETVVVLGRADRAPFVVLTRAQALTALIKQLTDDGIPPESKGIANIKAEIAAMSAAEAAQPACRGGKEVPNKWLTDCTGNAMYQVQQNPAYFDRAKPRTSVQLVTFRVTDAGVVGEDKDEGDRLRQAFAQIDLAAVRKLLE